MIELITSPQKAFSSVVRGKPNPLAGFLVAGLALFLLALAKQVAMRTLPAAATLTLRVPVWVIAPAVGFLGALFLWGALTFGLTLVLGDSARTAQLVGWAFVPFVILGLVEVVVAAWWPVSVQAPPRPEDLIQVLLWSAEVQTLAQKATTFRIFAVLEFIAVLWGVYLLWMALKAWKPPKAAVGAAVFGTFMLGFWLLRNLPSLGG